MASLLRYSLIIPKEEIYYVSWTVDAYEGLGFLRTDDASAGAVSLLFSSDYLEEVEKFIDSLADEGIDVKRADLSSED